MEFGDGIPALIIKATHQEIKVRGRMLKCGQYVSAYSKVIEDLAYKERCL
ncbi:hypothetical protein [Lysinibacillus contaminans]|nr:hypothetical protein [Lysinibacillus contaminans]